MKVLILTEYFPDASEQVFTGGVESRVFHLVKFLDKRHEVDVIKRTDVYSFNSPATAAQRVIFFLSQALKILFAGKKYDLVEGTNFTTHILAFLYARRVGAKAVAWWPDVFMRHGVSRLGLASGLAAELAERLAIKLPWDGVIALSGETKKKLVKAAMNEKKMTVIYGGAEIQKYQKVPKSTKKYKKATIICIARLVKYKRVQDLLLAIYFLRERFKDIRVIIVGDGPEKENLFKLCAQLLISSSVVWKKGINEREKTELLSRSHVFSLPSEVEGFGLATVEALSAGTPVINADIPINREILGSQRLGIGGGLLFKPGDSVDLAEKIEMLLTDKKLYNQKVSEGRELIKRYEWEKVNRQTERFYKTVIAKE